MKTFRSQSPLLMCFALLLVSCRTEEAPAPIEQLMPLKTGNEWNYKVTEFDSNGNVVATSTSKTVVVRDTLINNSVWYVLSGGSIVQNNSKGYVYFNKFRKPEDQAVMIYQSSAYGGIGYMYQYPNYNLWVLTTRSYVLAPIPDALENLSGYTYEIKKQHQQTTNSSHFTFRQRDYVNPKVGLVRSDKYYIDSENLMRRAELISYILK